MSSIPIPLGIFGGLKLVSGILGAVGRDKYDGGTSRYISRIDSMGSIIIVVRLSTHMTS